MKKGLWLAGGLFVLGVFTCRILRMAGLSFPYACESAKSTIIT